MKKRLYYPANEGCVYRANGFEIKYAAGYKTCDGKASDFSPIICEQEIK